MKTWGKSLLVRHWRCNHNSQPNQRGHVAHERRVTSSAKKGEYALCVSGCKKCSSFLCFFVTFVLRFYLITDNFAKELFLMYLFLETPDYLAYKTLKGRKHLVKAWIMLLSKQLFRGILEDRCSVNLVKYTFQISIFNQQIPVFMINLLFPLKKKMSCFRINFSVVLIL